MGIVGQGEGALLRPARGFRKFGQTVESESQIAIDRLDRITEVARLFGHFGHRVGRVRRCRTDVAGEIEQRTSRIHRSRGLDACLRAQSIRGLDDVGDGFVESLGIGSKRAPVAALFQTAHSRNKDFDFQRANPHELSDEIPAIFRVFEPAADDCRRGAMRPAQGRKKSKSGRSRLELQLSGLFDARDPRRVDRRAELAAAILRYPYDQS